MSIQESFNNALFTIAHSSFLKKGIEGIETSKKLKEIEAKKWAASPEGRAEAEQNAREEEAQARGFSSAQNEHDVQEAVKNIAREKGLKFYGIEPQETAFGEKPETFGLGKPDIAAPEADPKIVDRYLKRAKHLRGIKTGLKERIATLENRTIGGNA